MRAVIAEAVAPRRHQISGMALSVEDVLAQQLIAHAPGEALRKTGVHGLAGY
jgi:hypothetical protein